jgi:thiosulfate/3-mercaptopyruvate sulfurtransferase
MMFRTLISTQELAARLDDPRLVIVDCRFELKDVDAGQRLYQTSHIPGAVYAHLDRDLSGAKTGTNGRHPLPDPSRLAATLGALGIGNDSQVVAYDLDSGSFASRLWWMVRWLGHDGVALLDGGFAKWFAEDRPLSSDHPHPAARHFTPHVRRDMLATAGDVAAHAGPGRPSSDHDARWLLLDARAPERYRGDVEPLDQAAGHIPGARNHFFQTNLDEHGTFRAPADLAAHFRSDLNGMPPEAVVVYCGSGVTACQNLLALEHAGLPGAKLYAGSWSEWSADPDRAVATGEEPPSSS